jgi:hypothetical protein
VAHTPHACRSRAPPGTHGYRRTTLSAPVGSGPRQCGRPTSSPLPIKGLQPGGEIPFSFFSLPQNQSSTRLILPLASHCFDRPFLDSLHLELRQSSPVPLLRFSWLNLTSSDLHDRSHCRLLPLNGELPPPHRSSPVACSSCDLMSSTSPCN